MLSGSKLQFLRYTHGITQKQMAEWCDVSIRYIGMVEHHDQIPSEEVYKAWLNCCYGVGEPIKKKDGAVGRPRKKKQGDE